MILGADLVAALEDDKSSIVVATGSEIHEALDASEAGSLGVCRGTVSG